MCMELLTSRYQNKISGGLDCFDRLIFTGTLPQMCYAQGMTSYLYSKRIRIFDYPSFAGPFKDQLRENAERIAKENGIDIEYVAKAHIRIATFLGHRAGPRYQGEIGNNYNIRIEGSRIKHTMGKSSIKMYDKFSKILRIETTTNDVGFSNTTGR